MIWNIFPSFFFFFSFMIIFIFHFRLCVQYPRSNRIARNFANYSTVIPLVCKKVLLYQTRPSSDRFPENAKRMLKTKILEPEPRSRDNRFVITPEHAITIEVDFDSPLWQFMLEGGMHRALHSSGSLVIGSNSNLRKPPYYPHFDSFCFYLAILMMPIASARSNRLEIIVGPPFVSFLFLFFYFFFLRNNFNYAN